jgi:guanylate kinase
VFFPKIFPTRQLQQRQNQKKKRKMKTLVICSCYLDTRELVENLLKTYGNNFSLPLVHTSKPPAIGEINGVHHHFVTSEAINLARNRGLFIEVGQVESHWYATSLEAVDRIHRCEKICIMDLNVSRTKQLKAKSFPAKYIFVSLSSPEILEGTIISLPSLTEEQITEKVSRGKEEMDYGLNPENFDATCLTDDSTQLFALVKEHLEGFFPEIIAAESKL